MSITKVSVGQTLGAALALLLLGQPLTVVAEPFLPDFAAATFSDPTQINNPYFPMANSNSVLFSGSFFDEDEGEIVTESFELTNLGLGPVLLGVQTRIQQDLSFDGELLVEATDDYYAQDDAGNVWYFGEAVLNYVYDDDDNLISTNSSSSWLAGDSEALPGYIMPIDLTVGFEYYQEFAPNDDAIDIGEIFALNVTRTVGDLVFNNLLQILETNPLEDDAREFKYYAPGLGLVLVEEGLDENYMNPELTVSRVTSVPEPGTLGLLGLGALAWIRRRPRKR